MIQELQKILFYYLVGIKTVSDLVEEVDLYIEGGNWIDEFEELTLSTNISDASVLRIIKYGENLKLSPEDYIRIELDTIELLCHYLKNNIYSWKELQILFIKILNIKRDFFSWTSNETPELYYSIIDDYELRAEGFSGRLRTANDLFKLILEYKCLILSSNKD